MRKIIILLLFFAITVSGCGFSSKPSKNSNVPQTFEEYQKKNPKVQNKLKRKNNINKNISKNNDYDSGIKTTIRPKAVEFGILLSEIAIENIYTHLKGEMYDRNSNKRIVFYTPAPNDVTYEQMDDKMKFSYIISSNIRNDNELKQYFIFMPYNYFVYKYVEKLFTKDKEKQMIENFGDEFNSVCAFFCVANPRTGTVYYYNNYNNMKLKTSQLKTILLKHKNL